MKGRRDEYAERHEPDQDQPRLESELIYLTEALQAPALRDGAARPTDGAPASVEPVHHFPGRNPLQMRQYTDKQ